MSFEYKQKEIPDFRKSSSSSSSSSHRPADEEITPIIDLYGILGLKIDVCQKPNCDELIQEAYHKKALENHPDKRKKGSEQQNKHTQKKYEELFMLIKGAYEILSDEKQRHNYNNRLKLEKQSTNSFFKLKKTAVEYADTEYKVATDSDKLVFKEQMKLMNEKQRYDPDIASQPISKRETKKMLQSHLANRASQDKELKPENIFEGMPFSPERFNEAFDLNKDVDETDGALTPYDGVPSAWNGSAGQISQFSNFDENFDLFVEDASRLDISNQTFGSFDHIGSTPKLKLTKEFVSGLQGANYYNDHSDIGDSYYVDMKKRLSQRGSDQNKFENMNYDDFKRDDTAGYGIFEQLGFKYEDRLNLDMENEDIASRFNKLMTERKK